MDTPTKLKTAKVSSFLARLGHFGQLGLIYFCFRKWGYESISTFSRVQSTSEKLNVSLNGVKLFYGIHWKRINYIYFIVYTPTGAYDILTYVAKQNMNVMTLTISGLQVKFGEREREKTNIFGKSK